MTDVYFFFILDERLPELENMHRLVLEIETCDLSSVDSLSKYSLKISSRGKYLQTSNIKITRKTGTTLVTLIVT